MRRLLLLVIFCPAFIAAQDIDEQKLLRMRDSLDNLLMVNPTASAILIRKGEMEFYSFSGLMSSKTFNNRDGKPTAQPGKYSFFTSLLQFNFGISKSRRINAGIDVSYRAYRYDTDKGGSALKVFGNDGLNVAAINYAGFRVRVQPFKRLRNFTYQSYLWFPIAAEAKQVSLSSTKSNWGNTLFYYKYLTPRIGFFAQANITLAFPTSSTPGPQHATEFYLPLSFSLSYVASPKNIFFGSLSYSWINDDVRNAMEGADHDFAQLTAGYQRIVTKRFFLNVNYTGTAFSRNYGEWNSFNFGLRYLY
jgi:hypothetical protein